MVQTGHSVAAPAQMAIDAPLAELQPRLVSARYGDDEPNQVDRAIDTGYEAYGLAKWMWGLMVSFTTVLLFGLFRAATWYETRKYHKNKASENLLSRATGNGLGRSRPGVSTSAQPSGNTLSAGAGRRTDKHGRPVFGQR